MLSTIGKVFDSSSRQSFFPHRISFIKPGMSLIWIQFFSTPAVYSRQFATFPLGRREGGVDIAVGGCLLRLEFLSGFPPYFSVLKNAISCFADFFVGIF